MKGGNTGSEIWVRRECSWEGYPTAGTLPGLPLESLSMQPESPGDGQLNSIKEEDEDEVVTAQICPLEELSGIFHTTERMQHWKPSKLRKENDN